MQQNNISWQFVLQLHICKQTMFMLKYRLWNKTRQWKCINKVCFTFSTFQ